MPIKSLPLFSLAGALLLAAPPAISAEVAPDQMLAAIEASFGVTPGQRRNHIKGTCAVGEFVGDPAAARYTRSPLFSGKPVPVLARFSLAGGNPKVPDATKSVRGMALQFKLADGQLHQMAMINTPVFGASSTPNFLELIQSLKPDPATGKPDPEKIKAFRASHPETLAQVQFLATNNPPVSYANSAYFGIHTFRLIDRKDQTTLARWRFVPQDGEKRLSDEELKAAGPNFLEAALIGRTQQGPVRWDMMLTIGQAGDTEDNPTVAWPEDRLQLKVGTLSIASASPQAGAPCEAVNFDPLVMADGIAPSSDPILMFRSPVYAGSFARRLGGK